MKESLGYYYTPEEAEAVYKAESERLQGQFAAHLSRKGNTYE